MTHVDGVGSRSYSWKWYIYFKLKYSNTPTLCYKRQYCGMFRSPKFKVKSIYLHVS